MDLIDQRVTIPVRVSPPGKSDGDQIMSHQNTVGAWAKRYHLANRALIEAVLRPYDLGSTQWHVLYVLVHDGPTLQRKMGHTLHIERATLSGIVATLVRKGLVVQNPDPADQRQRILRLTAAGTKVWSELPDPIAVIETVSLAGIDAIDLNTAIRVLEAATQRIGEHMTTNPTAAANQHLR